MSKNMIEQVAMAIARLEGGSAGAYLETARAAIEVMRNPTPKMVAAGECVIFEDRPTAEDWQLQAVKDGWQAMIDAALEPK